jgi:hypothetical protein
VKKDRPSESIKLWFQILELPKEDLIALLKLHLQRSEDDLKIKVFEEQFTAHIVSLY